MEIKKEIYQIVDTLPATVLEEVIIYLRKIKTTSTKTISLSQNLNQVLQEDKEVLEKLAKTL